MSFYVNNIILIIMLQRQPTPKSPLAFFVIMCLLASVVEGQLLLLSVNANPTTIRSTSIYTLQFNYFSSNSIPIDSTLTLSTSSDYDSAFSSSLTCSSVPHALNQTLASNISCTHNANTLTISGLFSSSSTLNPSTFTVTVTPVTNPTPARQYTPFTAVTVLDSSGGNFVTSPSSIALTITPASATCSAAITNPLVFGTNQMTITYTSTNVIDPATHNLTIVVPRTYADDPSSTPIDPSVPNSVLATTSTEYTFNLNFVSSVTMTLRLPPSTKPESNFITIYSTLGSDIVDTCSLTISGIQPTTFTNVVIPATTVQTTTDLALTLTLSTPVSTTDILTISFDSNFDLSSASNVVTITGRGSHTFSRAGNTLTGSSFTTSTITAGQQLIITISNVILPFTTVATTNNISISTSDSFQRISQSYLYSASAGALTNTISCLNTQIGISTTCTLSVTTSQSMNSNSNLFIQLPSTFTISSGSQTCPMTGTGLNTFPTCTYTAGTNSISISSLTSSSSNISPLTFTVDLPLTIPSHVDNHSLTVSTQINGNNIDTGTAVLTATTRTLSDSQFNISSSSSTTYSATIYSLKFNLPLSLGVTYSVSLMLPLDTQSSQTPALSGGTTTTYNNQTLSFSSSLTGSTAFELTNLLTPASTQPTIITLSVVFNGNTYFSASHTLTMTTLKTFDQVSVSSSSQVVYSTYTATFSLSGLSNNDVVILTSSYSQFYPSTQTSCSTGVVTCEGNGRITVLTAGTTNTEFNVTLRNLPYVGTLSLNITNYESSGVYPKQSSLHTLSTTTPNTISISAAQSNPYLLEATTYTFNLTLNTPNATSLTMRPASSFTNASATCLLNCAAPSATGSNNFLFSSISSTTVIVTLSVTNPNTFDSTTIVVFESSRSQGQVDQGQFQPSLQCDLPCRSCASSSRTTCTSCYAFQTELNFNNNTCLASCPDGTYSALSNALYSCQACYQWCAVCSGSSTNCSTCIAGGVFFNNQCDSTCPSGSFSNSGTCQACLTNCSICTTASDCSSCLTGTNLFNNTCIQVCPSDNYALNGVCLACDATCQTCDFQGCISCANARVLYQRQCFDTCPTGTYADLNLTIPTCMACNSLCTTCVSLATCTACTTAYRLYNGTCLTACPTRHYYDDTECLQCPTACAECTFANSQPACTECNGNQLIYSYTCVATCPADTRSQSGFCISESCEIEHCTTCSGFRCVQCRAGYDVNSDFGCTRDDQQADLLKALSQIPVPFPFLISIIIVLLISFLIKFNFPKMFTPLFIYAITGVLEFCCMGLWIVLAVTWNRGSPYPKPLFSIVNAPVVIGAAYYIFNITQLVLWRCRIVGDKRYQQWERQDNKSASITVAIIALILSFRFDTLKYSRVAHNYRLSARVSQPEVFYHYSLLAILSIFFLTAPMVVVAVYITSLQTQLNYLYFTGLQIAIVGVFMAIFSFVLLCVPKQSLVEDRQQYVGGKDEDNIMGSRQELFKALEVVEQHHEGGDMEEDGMKVMRRNEAIASSSDGESQQELTIKLLHMGTPDEVNSQNLKAGNLTDPNPMTIDKEGLQGSQMNSISGQTDQIFAQSVASSDNHILVDHIERDRVEIAHLNDQYAPKEKELPPMYPKQTISESKSLEQFVNRSRNHQTTAAGSIVRQRFSPISEDTEQVSSLESYEVYRVNLIKKEVKRDQQEQQFPPQEELATQDEVKRGDYVQGLIEEEHKWREEERIRMIKEQEQREKEEQERIIRKKKEQLERLERQAREQQQRLQKLSRQQKERIQKQQKQQRQRKQREEELYKQRRRAAYRQRVEEEKIAKEQQKLAKQKEQQKARIRQQQKLKEEQRIRQQKIEEGRRQIERLTQLKKQLLQLEQAANPLQKVENILKEEEEQLNRVQRQRERQNEQRALMAIEDKLSHTTELFYKMNAKPKRSRPKRIPTQPQTKNQFDENIQYQNNDVDHLVEELSPKRIKVASKPSPQMYKRQHIFVEENGYLEEELEQPQSFEVDVEIVYEAEPGIQKDSKVQKPKSVLRKNKPSAIERLSTLQQAKKQIGQHQPRRKSHVLPKDSDDISLGPMQYEVVDQKLDTQSQEDEGPPESPPLQAVETPVFDAPSESMERVGDRLPTNQVIIEEETEMSIRSSQSSHWPIEPQMQQRLHELDRRADHYLKQPKKKEPKVGMYIQQEAKQEVYIEEQDDESSEQVNQIVFEPHDSIIDEIALEGKRVGLGRVNRRVIDLSPHK